MAKGRKKRKFTPSHYVAHPGYHNRKFDCYGKPVHGRHGSHPRVFCRKHGEK